MAKLQIPKFADIRDLLPEQITIHAAYKNPHVHFYWLVASIDPEDPDVAYGFANLNNPDCAEWGDFSISEILDNKDNLGGQKIEGWVPCLFPEAQERIEVISAGSAGLEFMGAHSWRPPYWPHRWLNGSASPDYVEGQPGSVVLSSDKNKDALGIGQYRKLRKAVVDLIFASKQEYDHRTDLDGKPYTLKRFSLGGDPTPREIDARFWLLDLVKRYPHPTRRNYTQIMKEIAERTITENAKADANATTENA